MKKLTCFVSLLLFIFGCASTQENAFQRDLDAFDNLPPSTLLQGTYTGSYSAPTLGAMVTAEDKKQ